MDNLLEIDGSTGEGGGQILRTSLCLSLMNNQPIRLFNIRANRKPKPGLQAQHLQCVKAAQRIGCAHVVGAELGSQEIVFTPGVVQSGDFHFRIGTAGSVALVLHTIYLPLCLKADGPSTITIEGGTHVRAAPTFPFLEKTWQGHLQSMGLKIVTNLLQTGFYPRGGGKIAVQIDPVAEIHPRNSHQVPKIEAITIDSVVAGLESHIQERMLRKARQLLRGEELHIHEELTKISGGPGAYLAIVTETSPPIAFVGLGELRKSAEQVGADAVKELLHFRQSHQQIDPHSADQIMLPLCFATGPSKFTVSEITQHLLTQAWTIQQFKVATILIEGELGGIGKVTIEPVNAPSVG
ncbi:MAG: RNA 3'-terminal phosphate cyclase [Zavarzinella sp.]